MTARPPGLRAGLLLAALYTAVVAATGLLTDRSVRPLFDGPGGSTPYRWVHPPWYVAGNVKPEVSHTEVAFDRGASPLIGLNSDDSQLLLNLPRGALPAHGGDTAVRVSFTPLDPRKLADLPGGMRPSGNAYRVEMAYRPSGVPLDETTAAGNVIMIVPDEGAAMLYSPDGEAWEELPSHRLGDPNTLGADFTRTGHYLVGTLLPEFVNPNRGEGSKRVIGVAMVVASLALLFGYVVPTVLRRSRAAQAAAVKHPPKRTVRRRR